MPNHINLNTRGVNLAESIGIFDRAQKTKRDNEAQDIQNEAAGQQAAEARVAAEQAANIANQTREFEQGITREKQDLANQAGARQQSDFTDKKIFTSAFGFQLKASGLSKEQQDELADKRIIEIEKAGGIADDTREWKASSLEERKATLATSTQLGNSLGLIEPLADGNTTKVIKAGGRVQMIDGKTGEVIRDLGSAPVKGPLVSIGGDGAANSKGNIEQDKLFAATNLDWIRKGRPAVATNLKLFKEAMGDVKTAIASGDAWVGDAARLLGNLPAIAQSNKSKQVQSKIRKAVMGILRPTLGAQFTENEGERIIASAYDPTLPGSFNIEKIENEIAAIESIVATNDDMSRFWNENKTIFGYVPISLRETEAPGGGKNAQADSGGQEQADLVFNPATGGFD